MITKEIPVNWAVQTGGDGLWSSRSAIVEVTKLTIKWEGGSVVEINASFDPNTWNVEHYGLIYTDKMFLEGIRRKISDLCGNNTTMDYTEQGMQGEDYVSLECNDCYAMISILNPTAQEIIEEMEAHDQGILKEIEVANETYNTEDEE
jgi:hypothetical protein